MASAGTAPAAAWSICRNTPALAVLEMRAHLDLPYDSLTHDHLLLRVALPADVEEVEAIPPDPRAHGDAWQAACRSAVLRVPSLIVQDARNLLLNPAHPRAAETRLLSCTPFRFDERLWGGGEAPHLGRPECGPSRPA